MNYHTSEARGCEPDVAFINRQPQQSTDSPNKGLAARSRRGGVMNVNARRYSSTSKALMPFTSASSEDLSIRPEADARQQYLKQRRMASLGVAPLDVVRAVQEGN